MPDPTRDAVEPAYLVTQSEVAGLLTAAEARGREQERARLAALTEGEVREMVEALMLGCVADMIAGGPASNGTLYHRTTLLAAFAAQRERVVGECAEVADSYEEREDVDTPTSIGAAIRALLAAPTKGVGDV